VTQYDRVIPPGGTGTVTLTIDTSRVIGDFQKRAVVWSNDLERRSIALYLTGFVKPLITLEPGGYVGLWGDKGQVPAEYIDIVNNVERPIKITSIESDIPQKIRWQLKEIRPGYSYQLVVENISKEAGEYSGHLVVKTDLAKKPQFVIIVNGNIR
jgi:hypothetical protein